MYMTLTTVPMQCNWETEDNAPRIETAGLTGYSSGSEKGSISSSKPSLKADKNASSISLSVPKHEPTSSDSDKHPIRISYLTEQTSHHPPVSAFHITCPEKGLSARGFDQITAKFTGTSVKVLPGEHNMGIFISLDRHGGETYQLTHPAAHLGGLLRGSLSVSVSEMAYITCPETKLKAILHYFDEGWLGRSTNKIDGVIFRYDPENDNKTKVQDVPEEDVLVRLSGPWREKVIFTIGPKPVVSLSAAHVQYLAMISGLLMVLPEIRARGPTIHDNRRRPITGCSQDLATGRAANAK